jgi:pteridine reductase
VRGYLAHGVSKAAVEGLVRALALELAPEVSVNGIAPGTVLVPEGLPRSRPPGGRSGCRCSGLARPRTSRGRPCSCAPGPAFITGQILAVDGGQSLV